MSADYVYAINKHLTIYGAAPCGYTRILMDAGVFNDKETANSVMRKIYDRTVATLNDPDENVLGVPIPYINGLYCRVELVHPTSADSIMSIMYHIVELPKYWRNVASSDKTLCEQYGKNHVLLDVERCQKHTKSLTASSD